MEEEKVPSKPADARIVRTVRKLKSNVNHTNTQLEENKSKDKFEYDALLLILRIKLVKLTSSFEISEQISLIDDETK